MANIFITYSRQEASSFATLIAKKLKTIGHNVVWDVKLSLGESTFGVIKDNYTNIIILIATKEYALDESSEEFEAVTEYTLEVDDVVVLPIRIGKSMGRSSGKSMGRSSVYKFTSSGRKPTGHGNSH